MKKYLELSRVVGLTGLPRTGKDSVAEYLFLNHGFTCVSFAEALYEEVSEAYDAPIALLQTDDWKTKAQRSMALTNCRDREFCEMLRGMGYQTFEPMTSRKVLQLWGTEYRRHSRPTYWIDKMDNQVRELTQLCVERIVISDCRVYENKDHTVSFNEGDYVHELGGRLYEVVRPGAIDTGHSSDWKFPPAMIAGLIANVGSLEDLHSEAENVLEL